MDPSTYKINTINIIIVPFDSYIFDSIYTHGFRFA